MNAQSIIDWLRRVALATPVWGQLVTAMYVQVFIFDV
jgi:hypothetical protein